MLELQVVEAIHFLAAERLETVARVAARALKLPVLVPDAFQVAGDVTPSRAVLGERVTGSIVLSGVRIHELHCRVEKESDRPVQKAAIPSENPEEPVVVLGLSQVLLGRWLQGRRWR